MISETLIIFTRYPEPGKTKTRLIPCLGAEGAANLQRQMTETTVKIGKQLNCDRPLEILIYFAGGQEDLMKTWLGEDLNYKAQRNGDLGQRMESAFQQAFNDAKERVVMIGIDCPQLNSKILDQAFEALLERDLILGPAEDGGYYLIGLNCPYPQLFKRINWGTNRVLSQTQAIAYQLGLKVDYLPILKDIDRPEDLANVVQLRQNNGHDEQYNY